VIALIKGVLNELTSIISHPPISLVVAAAGPVQEDRVKITNWEDGGISIHAVSSLSPSSCVSFLNDLEAACYGVVALSKAGRFSDYFESLWGPDSIKQQMKENEHYVGNESTLFENI